jgi:four helix bundle protein
MRIFEASKTFPKEERYSLTDQIRRSSRAVSANIAEAWMKRRYEGSFVAKLTDSTAELAETEDWLAYARDCEYLPVEQVEDLLEDYSVVLKTLNAMILYSRSWCEREKDFKPQATSHKPQATNHHLISPSCSQP